MVTSRTYHNPLKINETSRQSTQQASHLIGGQCRDQLIYVPVRYRMTPAGRDLLQRQKDKSTLRHPRMRQDRRSRFGGPAFAAVIQQTSEGDCAFPSVLGLDADKQPVALLFGESLDPKVLRAH